MMRMVIGGTDYLQSLRIVARARMLRVSERTSERGKRARGKTEKEKPLSSSLLEGLNEGT